jgi:hypothetical protein
MRVTKPSCVAASVSGMHLSLLHARALLAAMARGAAELLALQRWRMQEWLLHRAR